MAAAMWPKNGPDRLEDICLRYLAKNLLLIAKQGQAKKSAPSKDGDDVGDSVDALSAGCSVRSLCDDGEFDGSSSVDPEIKTCYHLRPGVFLPKSVCDRFLDILLEEEDEPKEMTYEKLCIFADSQAVRLSRLDLRCVADHSLVTGLKMLSSQPLQELIMPCVWRCLPTIKNFSTLRSLRLEHEPTTNAVDAFIQAQGQHHDSMENIHSVGSLVDGTPLFSATEDYYKLTVPSLQRLVLHNLQFRASPARDLSFNSRVVASLLSPLQRLAHLSLAMCRVSLDDLACLSQLISLVSLNLSNIRINNFPAFLKMLQPLKKLKHLDVSQGDEEMTPVIYPDADGFLKDLTDLLPDLVSIDLSGTNLAGFEPPEAVTHSLTQAMHSKSQTEEGGCSIPGLEGKQLEFLGLFYCAYNPCYRKHIPAKRVTGDADCAQIVLAVQVYLDNHFMLIKALNDLFNLFRYATVADHRHALEAVLAAMKAYPKDSGIQIAGSASLFYIAKGEHKQYITYQLKRDLVNLLLSAMYEHCFDQTMMRNACLTLCHLNLPADVMFCYQRLVKQLLEMLKYDYRDEFIHRLGIFLLNCLACQVEGKEKELVGRLGAVETMLQIIARKLRSRDCDDVLEVAWSTLWNVTDETPSNCQKFLTKGGMQLFVSCLEEFKDKPELLRNMMGLMGNIAEVDSLRRHLMVEKYVTIFTELLDSKSDGIEVSYNACGVLSHLCFDGPCAWTLQAPSQQHVMDRMRHAIQRWPVKSKRNINYRSFEPILRLVNHYDTPIVQHWACWALRNLTSVSPEKYCRLLERERGREVLERLVSDPRPEAAIKKLAEKTLEKLNLQSLRSIGESDADSQAGSDIHEAEEGEEEEEDIHEEEEEEERMEEEEEEEEEEEVWVLERNGQDEGEEDMDERH